MIDHDLIERASLRFEPPDDALERFTDRRRRRQRNKRIGSAVLALLLALVAIGGAAKVIHLGSARRPTPANSVTPPAVLHGLVAFASGGDANGRPLGAEQVYVVDASGRVTPLTSTQHDNNEPGDWSPDGRRLIVQRNFHGDQGQDLFLESLDGSPEVRLTDDTTFEGEAHFSPDGSRIAFVKDQGIDVMNADGSHVRQLTAQAGTASSSTFAWSPDGTRIVFARGTQLARYDSDIYVAETDGGGAIRLTSGVHAHCHRDVGGIWCDRYESPAWSPDGLRIAFVGVTEPVNPGPSEMEVFVMNADGSTPIRLTGLAGAPSGCEAPAWSPDGSLIAVQCVTGVFVMDADGSAIRGLTGPGFYGATWSPDGSQIGVAKDHHMYVVNVDGSGLAPLTNQAGREWGLPLWRPSG
jgi:Tol biopolymer transport system component